MKPTVLYSSLALSVIVAAGCGKQGEQASGVNGVAPAAVEQAAPVVTALVTADTPIYEVGCGSCIFEMDGLDGCPAAIRADGGTYLIKGVPINAHEIGMCSGAMQARVEGEIKDGNFVATAFALVEDDTDDEEDIDAEVENQRGPVR